MAIAPVGVDDVVHPAQWEVHVAESLGRPVTATALDAKA